MYLCLVSGCQDPGAHLVLVGPVNLGAAVLCPGPGPWPGPELGLALALGPGPVLGPGSVLGLSV